jgi:phosphate transport system permease protein
VTDTANAVMTVVPSPDPRLPDATPKVISGKRGRGDGVFHGLTLSSGFAVMSILVAVGVFLSVEAWRALRVSGLSFFTTSQFEPERGVFGVAALIGFTAAIALIAIVIAVPISMGTALFIVEIAPARLRSKLVAMVDLMAAIPSVVYGLWGKLLLQGQMIGLSRWLSSWFGWLPIFKVSGTDPKSPLVNLTVFSASTFIAGAVVSMMVIPIQCSVMREVFSQVPVGEREGAFALGATRWGMIRVVSLPFGRGGIIGGTMLGLGRALGETIAVVLIISPTFKFGFHWLQAGSNSVSALIALQAPEASDFKLSALMAAGLALFAMTLVVNFVASYFVSRSRSGASSEA